jgi:hypothetical protein
MLPQLRVVGNIFLYYALTATLIQNSRIPTPINTKNAIASCETMTFNFVLAATYSPGFCFQYHQHSGA